MRRRYVLWLISGVFAVPVYFLAEVSGLSQVLVLLLTFLGAMVGAIAGRAFIGRLLGPDAAPPPPPARGPGRGRKGS